MAAIPRLPGQDRSADLRAKSIEVRLEAIDSMLTSTRKDVEVLLVPMLGDKDWEVQERVAMVLGKLRSKAALAPLIELALDGDVTRVRRAAASALAAIDPAEATARLWKQNKGKNQIAVLEALALVLRGQPAFAEAEKIAKLLRDQQAPLREAAAAAYLEGAADRAAALRQLLQEPILGVRCRALDAVTAAPRTADLEPLAAMLRGPGQNEVVGRRLLRALASVLALGDGDRAPAALDLLKSAGDEALVLARRARLLPLLVRGERPVLEAKAAVAALAPSLTARESVARAAAAKALREIGGEEALALALQAFPREPDPRVQYQLVETIAALRDPRTPEAVQFLLDVAQGNHGDAVRERALVRLGRTGVAGATQGLVAVANGSSWPLAVCAVVSLGKTRDEQALAPLLQWLKHTDWKLRGAAVVAAMHFSRESVVEPLIGMLGDSHPVVSRAAHEALRNLSRRYEMASDAKAWRAWWAEQKGKHDFADREASLERAKKYGYAVADAEIYRGLDVVVFKCRGDHIEQLLEKLKISYRATEKSQVLAAGVHPEAIFVSNCTGELGPADLEPLQWFVRTGGSLFGSCWALSETIAKIQPGVVQMAQTPEQVMDNVRALPCRPDSPLLDGVFPPAVVPIYHLEGAHLIQVLDQERCEVLIDSPDAAERHGCGNLAAWFHVGHGVLFDSANHFDLQGLAGTNTLRTDKERQAYAVDHMGLSFADWRATRSEGYWKNPLKAGKSVPDLSAFRLLTNFVRSKRMAEY